VTVKFAKSARYGKNAPGARLRKEFPHTDVAVVDPWLARASCSSLEVFYRQEDALQLVQIAEKLSSETNPSSAEKVKVLMPPTEL